MENNKKMSVKDFAKDNSGIRLRSIRVPRDLSLGGTKLQKKLYKPNINVIRNKNKGLNNFKEIKKRPVIVKEKLKERFVQSRGVFSEGINISGMLKVEKKFKSLTKGDEKGNNISSSVIHRPFIKNEKKPADNVMNDLLEFSDSSSSDSDVKMHFKPVTWSMIKQSVENEFLIDEKMKSSSNKVSNYFESTAKLSLWQLPSSFASKIDVSGSKPTKSCDVHLNDMGGGEIGRIFIRRSGRLEVFIGDKKYHLESSMLDSCTEDLVSINVCPGKSEVTVLSEIDYSFVLSPDWSFLLC